MEQIMTGIIDRVSKFTENTPECDAYSDYVKSVYKIQEYKNLTDSDIFHKMAEILLRIKRGNLSNEFLDQYDKCLSMLN